MSRIFDAHTHTYPELLSVRATDNLGKFYNFICQRAGTVDDLMASSRDAGVEGFLILGVATNARQVRHVNEAVAADVMRARKEGFRAFGYAAVHQDTENFEEELDFAISAGLTGAKIHPDIQRVDIDDARLYQLYEILSARGLPFCIHMGDDRPEYRYSEPKKLAHVLDMFPRLRVIATHLGGYRAWDEAIEYLAHRENVIFDSSSSFWAMTPELARRLYDALGVENIMFGTDYPVVDAESYLELFDKVPMTDDEREMMLWDNAARFFEIND